ncbi:MAG: nucleotide pyrophosphohydrolase [Sphaerochaetaceae bacterium]|jgi:NTP pyrophosphatase (non-canonical NTP hydrolase)|nr:nucleotide pyrophosphohydrolase [Sphaerochaetaceae bacterium]MDD3163338.1 nucleotide pyrophosphohydrolase [Sphaerochaetaceae bacterium]MDD4007191.1 nucleotide pyrophosphohydrolase [Sphaerochaetaceae bacterium]MDD4396489.1 nucleotide pyrophosphohydrolase [Sphaerochaetaceae bacterium]
MNEETKRQIAQFTADRNWDQFHSPKNLAISISLEASELLENFQWVESEEAVNTRMPQIREELADVLVYCEQLCAKLGLDQDEIIQAKMKKNAAKYPVGKSYGSCKKYSEL